MLASPGRLSDSHAPSQTYRNRSCIRTRSPGDSHAVKSLRTTGLINFLALLVLINSARDKLDLPSFLLLKTPVIQVKSRASTPATPFKSSQQLCPLFSFLNITQSVPFSLPPLTASRPSFFLSVLLHHFPTCPHSLQSVPLNEARIVS